MVVGDGVPVALVRKPGTVGLSSSRWLLAVGLLFVVRLLARLGSDDWRLRERWRAHLLSAGLCLDTKGMTIVSYHTSRLQRN